MREQTAYFGADFQLAVYQAKSFGFVSKVGKELINYNLTIRNPRNRVLAFPNIGIDLSKLWSIGVSSVNQVFRDDVEQIMIQLSTSDIDEHTSVLKDFTRTIFIRQNQLHSVVNCRTKDLLDDVQNLVFSETMFQEAIFTRLLQANSSLKLGSSFFNFLSISLDDSDSRVETILNHKSVYDIEMIPMDSLTSKTSILTNCDAGYWEIFKAAFCDEDESSIHKIFGQSDD